MRGSWFGDPIETQCDISMTALSATELLSTEELEAAALGKVGGPAQAS